MKIWKRPKTRTVILATAGLTLAVVIYLLVIPTVIAKQYLTQSEQKLTAIDSSFRKVAASAESPLFIDPDISLAERQQQLDETSKKVEQAQAELKAFQNSNRLLPMPAAILAGSYHTARVRAERAQSAALQSKQVLADYAELLDFLSRYTGAQLRLDAQLSGLNHIQDFDRLKGDGSNMIAIAAAIREDEAALRALEAPPGFGPFEQGVLESFSLAANNFEALGWALYNGSDPTIYRAVNMLEIITIKNTVDDKDLLVTSADKSPVLLQIGELPEKPEHVRGL